MKKLAKSLLCMVLSFLMILYLVPASVIAEVIDSLTDDNASEDVVVDVSDDRKVDALFELTNMRTEDTKYIRMSDGTYRAVVYKIPIHEKNENGVFEEVDNSLSDVGSDFESAGSRVKFAKKVTGNERIFTLKNGNHKISLSLIGTEKGTAITVVNDGAATEKAATKWEELTTLQNSVSSVRYNEILPGTDLEYLLMGSTLKENILINKKQNSYVYTFELALNNLTAKLTEEGDVLLLTDSGNILYQLPAPYMYDASGEYSDNAEYALTDSGNGKYLLTVTADSKWINADKRVFPITLDPTIDVADSADISDTYQDSSNKTVNHGGESYLYVGNKDGHTQYTLISINNLPELPEGSMVTEAELRLQITGRNLAGQRTVLMHKVISPSVLSGITGDTAIDYTAEAYDYEEVDAGTTFCYFDLTKMYHEWSENDGKILRLSMVGSSSQHTDYVIFASSNNTSYDVMTPYFELTYVNTLGIEDYYSYRTHSIGDAGTAYIGDHTGQLTLSRTDAISDNSALSVSVGHVYNSALAGGDYSVENTSGNNLFASMKTGAGFMLSTQQTLLRNSSVETYCEYRDGDGTIHYMRYSKTTSNGVPTEYQDTEGLGLTVIVPNATNFASKYAVFANLGFTYDKSLLMTDMKGNCWLFYNGLPAVFSDSNGNLVKYLYNTTSSSGTAWFPTTGSNALRAIVQNNKNNSTTYSADITVATFTYSSNYLSSITSSGRTLNFVYETVNSKKLLKQITVSETVNTSNSYSYTLAEYGYTNGILTDVYDTERQYGVHYDYDGNSKKYIGYYEFAGTIASKTKGSEYTIEYGPGQTSYRYLGAESATTDDIISVSVFDNYGRTISSYTQDASGAIRSATAGSYVDSDDFSNNRIADTSSIGITGANLLANPSMEKTSATTFSSAWNRSNSSYITSSTNVVHNGTYSVKMQFDDISDFSMYLYQNVYARTSGKHTFSVYVNMSGMQAVNPTSNGGVILQIYNTSTGETINSTVYTGNYTGGNHTPTDPNQEWHRIHVAFTAQANTQYQVRILGRDMFGTLYVDDAQLEKGSVPGAYNLLSMQKNTASGIGWVYSSTAITLNTANSDATLQSPMVFTPNVQNGLQNLYAYQTITNVKGKGFTLSGWAEAHAVPGGATADSDRYIGLRATVDYVNATTAGGVELKDEVTYVPFNTAIDGKQYACGTVIPTFNEECTIKIEIIYKNNVNAAKFYAISLAESDAIGYTYNSNGYRVATTKSGLEQSTYTYDGANLTSFAEGNVRTDITYTAEQNGYLPSTVTTQGITTEYTYDTAGNVTGTVIRPAGSTSLKINTYSTFDTRLAKLTSTTDERGNVTAYTYNADGSVKSVTLDGVETEYIYGKKGRQSQILIDSLASVMYFYDKGNLSQIVTGGIESSGSLLNYYLTYDSFGRTLSVKAGNEVLASYTYEAKTGNLLTMTYGNDSTLRYEYDDLGRTTKVYQDEMRRFEYVYDGSGNLCQLTDYFTNVQYIYRYNSIGNITAEEQYTGGNVTTVTFKQGQYYSYNSYGDVKESTLQIAGMDPVRYICTYDYENKAENELTTTLLNKWSVDNDHNIEYSYDELNRLEKETYSVTGVADNTTRPYVKTYGYLTNSNGTTTLVSSVTYSGYASRAYTYNYDARGNITAVYKDGTLQASYTYDDLGQLTRENNKAANKTYVYTYDDRGNILSRKTYAYTTSTLGAVQTTDSYGYYQQYDTKLWGDVLKSYNGTTFSYDDIGNPITYYNGSSYTFRWMQGRKLIDGTKGSTSFSYGYNSDGLRTSKTVGNQVYTYYWNGTQLAAMTVKTNGSLTVTMQFFYNAEGTPLYFTYNGTEYFYVTNLQGDVVGIANSNGIMGYYEYDAWGRIISMDAASSTEYSALTYNPLRYRGYIYDNETGFYYLQSRYYDPSIRRFINQDATLYHTHCLGYNLFAYCYNNPINYIDPYGKSASSAFMGWMSKGLLISIAEPTFLGEVIYFGGCIILGGIVLVETIALTETVGDAIAEVVDDVAALEEQVSATNLPNQGEVSEDPDAPPVDAGKQGKHVPGHNNNDPSKSQWKPGENGVKQTQEAWKNGRNVGSDGKIRVGQSSDGRTIRVHIDGSGKIHGYPIFP